VGLTGKQRIEFGRQTTFGDELADVDAALTTAGLAADEAADESVVAEGLAVGDVEEEARALGASGVAGASAPEAAATQATSNTAPAITRAGHELHLLDELDVMN
jgi:hypothetical protein